MQAPGSPPVPPQLAGPPGPVGGGTVLQPQMGAGASAMSDIRNALQALQKALPGIPMGTELHTALLKAVEGIAKHLDPSDKEANKGVDIQALLAQAKQQQQGSPQAALLRAMSPGGGGQQPAPPVMPGAPPMGGAPPPPQLAA